MFKVAWNITKKVFGVIFLILSPLKRLWCGLRRKRRTSDTLLPMTNHYPSVENLSLSQNGSSNQVQEELSPWDKWEDQSNRINSVQQYRQHQQQVLQQQQSQEEEPQMDYFQDMTPKLKKQKKVLIKKKDDHQINTSAISSKLAVSTDIPLMQSSELGAWEDTNNAWEGEADEDLSWEAENVIREKRKAERQQRTLQNQRKKQEKELQKQSKVMAQGHLAAVRLS